MRHVTPVLAPGFTPTFTLPATAGTFQPEDPVLRTLEGPLNLGPYADPNG